MGLGFTGLGVGIGAAVLTDFFDVLLGLSVVGCGLLFALHHAGWPALQRPIYALTRLEKPRRYVLLLGVALVILGFGKDLAGAFELGKSALTWLKII